MKRWTTSQTQEFVEEVREGKFAISPLEENVTSWFRNKRCTFCRSSLKNVEIERFEYLGWEISRFHCQACKNTLLKIYSREGIPRFQQGISSTKKRNYEIHWILFEGGLKRGSPITSSKDYVLKEGRGRPRKHDYRKIEALIWKALNRSNETKYGFDVARLTKRVKKKIKDVSPSLMNQRLKDMELRGLVTKERHEFHGLWNNFWRRIDYEESPQRIYKKEGIQEKYKDLEPFLMEIGDK